jgi:hypothetical protein
MAVVNREGSVLKRSNSGTQAPVLRDVGGAGLPPSDLAWDGCEFSEILAKMNLDEFRSV